MAHLGSYYGLCPLIDQKSLLGVTEDGTKGCIIVTLGKNMAIKYKLSDQKQLHSWSTKEKLSSPVVYDKKENRYVAVFNQNFLRIWNDTENNLDKLKKIKFPSTIHTILQSEDEPVLIFKSGYAYTLSYALKNRKNILQNDILEEIANIEDQTCLQIDQKCYIGLLVKKENVFTYLWMTPNNTDVKSVVNIPLERNNFNLIGHLATNTDNGPVLFTLWSDGRLFSYSLNARNEQVSPPGNFFSVIETLSRKNQICMTALNNNYVAMYGADSNQEGASLQIYNTQFKVIQSRHQFKLFSDTSKLWLINSCLFLTVGQNLAVVPFYLATEQLAALVGSHKLIATSNDEDLAIVTEVTRSVWEEDIPVSTSTSDFSLKLKMQVNSFLNEGWSESAICEEMFPQLIEKQDTQSIIKSLEYFADIPDNMLVKLLSFCVSVQMHTQSKNIITEGLPEKNTELMDKLLTVSYSDVSLMHSLRIGLTFDEVLILLQYVCFLLSENGHYLPNLNISDSERKLIDWGSMLLDAHYQQFLLSRDVKIIEILNYFKKLVDNYHACLEDLKKVEPILNRIKRGKSGTKITKGSLKYTIEKIKLY